MREEMIIRKEFVLKIVDFMESQFAKAESDGEQAPAFMARHAQDFLFLCEFDGKRLLRQLLG